MSDAKEKVVSGRRSGRFTEGEEVTWQARHFGVRWRMTSRITEIQYPHRFVDQQVTGPFAAFHHEHRFVELPEHTLLIDRISLRAPLGPLGRLTENLGLGRYMEQLIVQRNQYLHQAVEKLS